MMENLINSKKIDITKKISSKGSWYESFWHFVWLGSIVGVLLLKVGPVHAQQYDLLLTGGHVIDPKNEIDRPMDVAIAGDSIARIANNIPAAGAEQVVDVSGLYVTPGIVDIHGHIFHQGATRAVKPDGYTFRAGVTTIVDAGTFGWKNFLKFKRTTIDQAETRVLGFISIVGIGSSYKAGTKTASGITSQNTRDMDPSLTAQRIEDYEDIIVGVKAHHYNGADYIPEKRAVEAGRIADVPVVVDFGGHDPPRSLEKLLLDILRPGDMLAHTFADVGSREAIVDEDGRVKSYVKKAKNKGVLFNVGHGGGSFRWHQVIPAFEQGFYPDNISSDLHQHSMNGGMKNMANLMSKFLNIGMPLDEVIKRSTWKPAKSINREDLGHLSKGAGADVAVYNLKKGDYGFLDSSGYRLEGNKKLEAELTLRAGKVVWDLNGIAAPEWNRNKESAN